jgi:hypothetical protein
MKDTTKTILILVGIVALLITSIVLFVVDHNKNQREIAIVDKTGDVCAEAILYFYEDNNYKYYFNCLRNVFVQINDEEYEVSDALENKKVTLYELKEAGLVFYKEKIES